MGRGRSLVHKNVFSTSQASLHHHFLSCLSQLHVTVQSMLTGVSQITSLSTIFACLLVLLAIMYPCGEDCLRMFSSLRGLNRLCLNCQSYNTRHTGLMESLSTPVHLPEKRLRSSSEVSRRFLQFFPASHILNHSPLLALPLALPNNPRPRATWVPALLFCYSSTLKVH